MDELIKALEKLDGATVSVPMEVECDEDGFIDRQCPAEKCEFLYKLHEEDWTNIVRDEAVWCPFCGHKAPSDHWWTHDQLEYAENVAMAELEHSIGLAMKKDADRWNRHQPRNAFISMTMMVNSSPKKIILPAEATETMQLKITCSECNCRYAVIGSAFFCPSCGVNAAPLVFQQSLNIIRSTLDHIETVKAGIADKDTAENTARLLTENALQQLVTAFQRFAEALYEQNDDAPKIRRNVFQNLTEGSAVWHKAFGAVYTNHLSDGQLLLLNTCFQQRHLLAHREGLIDADYLTKTKDTSYKVGQRLVVRKRDVKEYLSIVEILAKGMQQDVTQHPPEPAVE